MADERPLRLLAGSRIGRNGSSVGRCLALLGGLAGLFLGLDLVCSPARSHKSARRSSQTERIRSAVYEHQILQADHPSAGVAQATIPVPDGAPSFESAEVGGDAEDERVGCKGGEGMHPSREPRCGGGRAGVKEQGA